MRTLSVLLALWQYYHCSVGRFGFGPQMLEDLALGTLLLLDISRNIT